MTRTSQLFLGLTLCLLSSCSSKTSEAEEAVRKEMVDPASAQFSDLTVCTGDKSVISGQVNAKNRMGAMAGDEPFFYSAGQVAFAGSPSFTTLMEKCYSNLHTEDSALEGKAAVNETGHWIVSTDTNPVDDSKTVTASLLSSEGVSSMGSAVGLVIRCQSNSTDVFANWGDYLGDDSNDVYDDWKYVTVRVGKSPARDERWAISTDSTGTFAPGSNVEFAKQLVGTDQLVLQTTPYNENPVTAVFKLDKIRNAVAPVAKACGWKL